MIQDLGADAAKYYDLFCNAHSADVAFYRRLLPEANSSVLELGCGTGRVLVPLAQTGAHMHGLDHSPAMLAICRQKLAVTGIDESRARVERRDICEFSLKRHFDLIIAPFRVMQNLESDSQVEGMLECIREHLSPGGTCVLNVFKPKYEPEEMRRCWIRQGEVTVAELQSPDNRGVRYVYSERWPRMDAERLILYPEIIYRYYENEQLINESVLQVSMRCWYPSQFEELVTGHGFLIVNRWGGYAGEQWGHGSELVLQFRRA